MTLIFVDNLICKRAHLFSWTLFALTGAFPVVGFFVGLLIYTFCPRWQYKEVINNQSDDLMILRELTDLRSLFFQERNRLGKSQISDSNIQSFIEVFRHQPFHQKHSAIAILQRSRSPNHIRLLQVCRSGMAPELVELATAALSKVEASWIQEIKELEAQAEADPLDALKRAEVLREYILLYESGLIPEDIANYFLANAQQHVEAVIQLAPNNAGIWQKVAQVWLLSKRLSDARTGFLHAIECGGDREHLKMWIAEVEYEDGEFGKMTSVLTSIDARGLHGKAINMLEQWKGAAS